MAKLYYVKPGEDRKRLKAAYTPQFVKVRRLLIASACLNLILAGVIAWLM